MSSDDEAPESFSISKGKENFFDELKEKKNAINIQKQQRKDINRQRQKIVQGFSILFFHLNMFQSSHQLRNLRKLKKRW